MVQGGEAQGVWSYSLECMLNNKDQMGKKTEDKRENHILALRTSTTPLREGKIVMHESINETLA